jgi:hypothetical protein
LDTSEGIDFAFKAGAGITKGVNVGWSREEREKTMKKLNAEMNWNQKQLWKGCILAGLAHAIMVAKYPLMANEQSWDNLNYSVQDSSGQRGTVSFARQKCVAAFRNDNSERINEIIDLERFFLGAPSDIVDLANKEALQYLLDEVEGKIKPLITTAFWADDSNIHMNDSVEEMFVNGGNLIAYQLMDTEMAIAAWKETYDMNEEQIQLLKSIYERKIENPDSPIILSQQEIRLLGEDDEGLEESRISFEEMGVFWS